MLRATIVRANDRVLKRAPWIATRYAGELNSDHWCRMHGSRAQCERVVNMVKEEKSLTITFDGSELFGAPTGPFPTTSDLFIQVRSIEHIRLVYRDLAKKLHEWTIRDPPAEAWYGHQL